MIKDSDSQNKNFFKKDTVDYLQSSNFNLIDIENSISKNKKIRFVDKPLFFYEKSLESNSSTKWKQLKDKFSEKTHSENLSKVSKLGSKHNILLSEMNFENENGRDYNFLEKYLIIDIIGEGSFGIVLKCWCRTTKKKVSVKIISKKDVQKETLKYFKMERQYLLDLNHHNIVQIYEFKENSNYILLILELNEWCTLKQLMIQRYKENNPFSEEEISTIINQLMTGINYMHLHKVMHRDIKPENIMFKEIGNLKSLKIIDLGLATSFEHGKIKKFCGTIKFMAPEIIGNKMYDQSVDLWACGIILFLLCSGGVHPIMNINKLSSKEYFKSLNEIKNWEFTAQFPM